VPAALACTTLQERSQAGELYALPEVQGFFDDQEHFKLIK
jgi:hypothetical protein